MFSHFMKKVEHSELIVPHKVAQDVGTLQGQRWEVTVFQSTPSIG